MPEAPGYWMNETTGVLWRDVGKIRSMASPLAAAGAVRYLFRAVRLVLICLNPIAKKWRTRSIVHRRPQGRQRRILDQQVLEILM